jgi:hypothetical protein
MVAALDDSADEKAPTTTEAGRPQTIATDDSAVSSFLKGNPPRMETASQVFTGTLPQPGIQFAQASVVLARPVTVAGQETATEAQKESVANAASDAAHSVLAKPGVADRPAATKSTPLQSSLPPLNDGSTAIAAMFYQPVQPAIMAKTPASSASQLPTVYTSNANAGAYLAIRPAESLVSDADGSSASHIVIANHPSETTVEPPAPIADGQASNQPAASSKAISAMVPVGPSMSAAVDNGVVGSLSSVSDAEAVRPQFAVARTGNGSGSVRVNRPVDSQLNLTAVQGIPSELNAATAGSAVVRDTDSVMHSNPGPGVSVQTASSTSTAETFSALDGASNSMQPTWIHAGAHQAEAGFEDPALGWVSVRAGVNAGGISAVVVPGSADAIEALGAHMAGLHDYLAEQHSPVGTLTLGTAENSGTDTGLNQGTQHQGTQHQGQQQSAQDNPANAQALSSIQPASTATASARATLMSRDESPAIQFGAGGRRISVMA